MKKTFTLDRFQREAIHHTRGENSVIVSAPTGAGKTLIAEQVIEDCLQNNKGIVYTAPVKALSNQKFRDFSKKYPFSCGILTGDVSLNPSSPILIMTTEIFRNTLLTNPERLEHREWVIFDEIHYLDDIERGTVWEEALILLPPHMKMLALSATIPNITQFINWLESIHHFPVKAVVEYERPVPLHFFFQCNNEFFSSLNTLKHSSYLKKQVTHKIPTKKYLSYVNPNKLSTLLSRLQNKNALPCIYFSFSRRRCEKLASEIHSLSLLTPQEQALIIHTFRDLIKKFRIQTDPYVEDIFPYIKRGIAYHHAGLLPILKEIIERLFTTGLIKLIFTTETFALGINMPAKTCVFDTLSKYYGSFYRYLKTRDFYQMAGRAGRRNIDNEGYVYLRINPHHIDSSSLTKIIHGSYEPIISQMRSSYATLLNLYTLMGEKLLDIYPLSFHCFQSNSFEKREARAFIMRKIELLKSMNYIVDNLVSEKGKFASKVYSFELQVGELFEKGFLHTLDEPNLFIAILALVYEPRRGQRTVQLSKRIKKLNKDLNLFVRDIHKKERQFRIYPLSKKFYFNLAEAARAWYEGVDFYKLEKYSTCDEGGLVRYFRMTIQVLREIHSSPSISEELKHRIARCRKAINRDAVDAEAQLRQEI